jgi:peptide chain release factor 2
MYLEEYKHILNDCAQKIEFIKNLSSYISKEQTFSSLLELKDLSVEDYKQISLLQNWLAQIHKCEAELSLCNELAEFDSDSDIWEEVCDRLKVLFNTVLLIETECMFNSDEDHLSALIEISSGAGGLDAQDWASMLQRMYTKFCLRLKFSIQIMELTNEDIGIRSCTLLVKGQYAYGWLKHEAGVHRMVRKSPFDNDKRHTSFASVSVYPEISRDIVIEIDPSHLRIDTMRSSGPGGQHVNKTESAVRITHLPTGLKAECQNDRSQHRNKEYALKCLKSKLYKLELDKRRASELLERDNRGEITWGTQIRSYVLDQSRIKDLRTGYVDKNITRVLDGHIDEFIYASLRQSVKYDINLR